MSILDQRLPTPTLSAVLQAALDYASRGWHVFPSHSIINGHCTCRNPDCEVKRNQGKHPKILAWEKNATTDVNVITNWLTGDVNVSILTGSVSGIFAIDTDPKHGGDKSWAALQAKHGAAPRTVTSLTGSLGNHYIYKVPVGQHTITKAKVFGPDYPGVDCRGDDGQIIAPPSRHISGRCYAWVDGLAPGQVEVAEAPAWVLAVVAGAGAGAKPEKAARTSTEWEALLGEIPDGGRNETLASVAGALIGQRYLDPGLTVALVHCVNEARCKPPLDPAEVDAIIASILRQEVKSADARARLKASFGRWRSK